MLHILWMLIKFILILLGILLGLAVLLILLLLFCPVRYRAEASKEQTSFTDAKAYVRVSWLFGGVSFKLWFREGKKGQDMRIFGLPVLKILAGKKNGKRKAGRAERPDEEKTLPDNAGQIRKPENADTHKIKTETADPQKIPPGNMDLQKKIPKRQGKVTENPSAGSGAFEEPTEKKETIPPGEGFFCRLGNKIRGLREKLKRIAEKIGAIPSKFRNLKLTIDQIYAKIEWWKDFLTHPRIQAALALVKDSLFRLLRHIFPTKIEGQIIFCCTDPSVTGTVLAVAGATMPLHKNCIRIHPVYEDENMLKGNLKLKGRIYGIVLVKTALQLFFNKDIKYSIKKWKKHKED